MSLEDIDAQFTDVYKRQLMVYLSACLTTVLLALALAGISDAPWGYIAAICVVLWATVLFGNFAESLAEGRGKAQADALRSAKRDVEACLIDNAALADAHFAVYLKGNDKTDHFLNFR